MAKRQLLNLKTKAVTSASPSFPSVWLLNMPTLMLTGTPKPVQDMRRFRTSRATKFKNTFQASFCSHYSKDYINKNYNGEDYIR